MAETKSAGTRRILVWHVHGSWTTSFVRGAHEYLLPVLPEGGPWGGGRCGRNWPDNAREVPAESLRDTDVDLVVLQRPDELALAARWLGRRPGQDVPAVYVEHNTPRGDAPTTRHPIADRADITLAHVTAFNELMWDAGSAPTVVIDHGIPDPGYRYRGELDSAAVVVNEPVRRGRVTGTDLLPRFADAIGLDVFGMGCDGLAERTAGARCPVRVRGDLPTDLLHTEMARRRCYLHPIRWTSLGLSLIEAMHLGMPVVGLATTEAVEAVPPDAGVLSTSVDRLVAALRDLANQPGWARQLGKHARETALARYGLARFLSDWDRLIEQAIGN
ncbi:MAG TPA: glycosyltransferase [Pseudonocardiaceae bacterium]|nr:glycosyltransferase [Pseudonocardiaceae bacterium]